MKRRTHGHYNSFRKLQVPDCEHLFTIIKATRSPYLRSNYRHLTCLEISCETSPGRRTRNGCRGWVHENMVTQAPQAVHFRVPASPNLLFDLSTNVRWAGIFWALRDFSAGRYHHDERKQSAADSNHCSCQSRRQVYYLHQYKSARRRLCDIHDVMMNCKVECQQNSGERSWSWLFLDTSILQLWKFHCLSWKFQMT